MAATRSYLFKSSSLLYVSPLTQHNTETVLLSASEQLQLYGTNVPRTSIIKDLYLVLDTVRRSNGARDTARLMRLCQR